MDVDYRILTRPAEASRILVAAPHGGRIEPGTSEIADAVAGGEFSFYAFEGHKPRGNGVLHMTSANFDEPQCLQMMGAAERAVCIHGEDGADVVVYVGGLDKDLAGAVKKSLAESGVVVSEHSELQGIDGRNICNRCQRGSGVQLEISRGFRILLFGGLSKRGRVKTTALFAAFVEALRRPLLALGDRT